mmetsp:Transcript_15782/g.14280  ORF Transcript_15782/g.14280 Transcript_15782/m.14280 type:complete len:205 (+) Transcript_15782:42-656(+)
MYLIRILIIGDTSVGKTSLLVRFNEDNYIPNQKTTIGVDYKAKEILIDNENIKLQIWDTAGQERFRSMTAAFYNRAQGIVLTFDVSQRSSFTNLKTWINDIHTYAPRGCMIIICANKIDISKDLWTVSKEEYESFANEFGFILFECSAESGTNVNNMFIELGRQILTNNRSQLAEIKVADVTERGDSVLLFNTETKTNKRRYCC